MSDIDELITSIANELGYSDFLASKRSRLRKLITQYGDNRELDGRIDGMKSAESRVLRRTEIPSDAKNPTRDWVVILGEEIAGFINQDIAELKKQRGES